MYKLIIQDDEGKTTVVPLIRDEITIGRKEGNTIRLTERNISRKHARIVKSNGAVVVEDLDSYNGVKVNGTRIQGRVAVNESDRIQIGDYLLELKVDRGNQSVDTGLGSQPGSTPGPISQEGLQPAGVSPVYAPTPVMGANGQAAAMRATKPTAPVGQTYDPLHDSIPPPSPPPPSHPSQPGVPSPAALAGQPGRLVVVSSNFGGREFVLSKPTMVIGRTDENDVVINHRSISRHHAKVVLEQGRYCIVDMQSANGVRVNGEEYGKVELRRGDVVDLGHVRLRYVEPGEDFLFDRDAQIVDISQKPGRSRGILLAVLSVTVLGGAAAVFLVITKNGTTSGPAAAQIEQPTKPVSAEPAAVKPPEPVAADPAPPPVPAVASGASDAGTGAAPNPVAAVAPPPKQVEAPPLKDDAAKLVADAKDAVAAEDWIKAYSAAEKALGTDPTNAEAKKLQEQAHAEYASQQTYKRFSDDRDAGKASEALKQLAQIPKTSYYRQKAEADLPGLHDAFIKEREGEARALAKTGQCERIAALARRSGETFPDAKALIQKAGSGCVAAAAPTPTAAEPPTTAPPTGANVAQLLSEAREAARNANWTEARKKADEVLRVNPEDQDALSVAGIAVCNMGDRDRALKYMSRLKGTRQNMIKQICANRGVTTD